MLIKKLIMYKHDFTIGSGNICLLNMILCYRKEAEQYSRSSLKLVTATCIPHCYRGFVLDSVINESINSLIFYALEI